MKKLFIFVSFMMLTTSWIYAQCDSTQPINNFQLITGDIQCENRGLITLNAPPVSAEHPAGTEFSVYWIKPGATSASLRGAVLAGQSMTIPNLAAGTYTFTLENDVNMSCEKPVTINDLYTPFEVKSIRITPATIRRDPVTNTNIDEGNGVIYLGLKRFTTGNSKYQVRVVSASTGEVLINDRIINSPLADQVFSIAPGTGERISYSDHPNISVFVREIPPGAPDNCRNFPSHPQEIQVPESVYLPGTYSLTLPYLWLNLHTTTRNVGGTNVQQPTGRFNLTIPLRRGVDGKSVIAGFIGGHANLDIPRNHFKGLGTSNAKATVQILNRTVPIADITSSFNGDAYSYSGADFQENDQVQIVVDDGLGNIVTNTFTLKGLHEVHNETPTTQGLGFSHNISPSTPVCPGAPVFLQIRTHLSRSERFMSVQEGGTLKINYNWYLSNLEDIWNATSSTSSLTYQYKVYKETAPNSYGPPLTQGTDYTIVDYRTIDVHPSGAGRYKIRMEFLKSDGTVVSAFERTTNINYLPTPTNRFELTFNTLQSNYGIAEGTTSFHIEKRNELMYEDPLSPGVSTVTISLGRADGQPSVSFETRLPFGQTKTETIIFPKEATVTPTYMGDPNGHIGFGDLPPGNYVLTIKDACGSASKTITLGNEIKYGVTEAERPFYKLVPRCGYYDLEFTHDALHANFPGFTQRMFTGLVGTYVDYSTVQLKRIQGRNGVFTGLKPGETYKIYTHEFGGYTIHDNLSVATTVPWTLLSTFTNEIGPGKPHSVYYMNRHSSKGSPDLLRYFTEIQVPSQTMDPVVTSIACGSDGTSMILVDLPHDTNVGIVGDVTYVLKSVSGTTEAEVASVTMTGGQRNYEFKNLPDGTYKVYVKDECIAGSPVVSVQEIADSSVFPTPHIINYDHPNGLCPGETTQMRLRGVSINSFDAEWYRINPDGSKVMVATNTQTFGEAVYTNTTYEVRVKLKDRFGCATNVWLTATSTSVLAIDTGVPSVTYFPADLVDYPSIGGCDVMVTWNEPKVTDENVRCGVQLTVTSTVSIDTNFNGGTQHQGRFGVGVHSVVYTFTDAFGNAVSRTLIVTVQDPKMEMQLTEGYSLNSLQVENEFYYIVKYRNTGIVTLTSATLEVQLPSNANVQPDLSKQIDFTNSGVSNVTYIYDSVAKKYTFTYPSAALPSTGGHEERSIGIPLKIVGGYGLAQQPCMNQVNIIPTMVYTGGVAGCTLRTQTATIQTSTVVEIKTNENKRTEIYCVGNPMTLSVTPGFDEYKWFLNGTPIGTNTSTFVATTQGEYRVEKYKFDCGVATIVSYEIIDYHEPGSSADPIKALAANVGVTCRNDNKTWTSHFYLCGGTSKTIEVNFVNSTLTWEKLNPSANGLNCQPRHETCPVVIDGCWEEVSNNTNTFTLSQGGRYRLKVAGANCYDFYYFDVFDSNTPAATVTHGDETGYVDGYININMSTQGVNYNYTYKNLTTGATGAMTTNTTQYRFTGLKAGTYVVEVTSSEALLSCLAYTQTITIQKNTNLKFTAEFVEWESCNRAKIKFKGEGGNPPYQFAVWSVDGEVLAPGGSHMNIPDSEWVGNQGEFDAHYEGLMNFTRIGSYVFVMRHQQNGERAFSAPINILPVGVHSVTFTVTDLDCATATGTGEIQLVFENSAVQREVSLYKLDDTGARILPARYQGSNLSLFTNLEVGNYEVAYTAQVASQTCSFVKRPISINPPANPLRAFVGVTKDKTCDTNGKYTVSVNNVIGGSGSYQYDFGTGYQNQPTAQVDGNVTVKIKDLSLSGCELTIPVTMQSPQAPTVNVSTPTYDCVGFGTVSVTAIAPPGQTHSYTYSVNTTTGAVQASVFTLSPGAHTIYVHYKPTGITPNILFKEDFGVGNDVCGSDLGYPTGANAINDLVCEQNVAVGAGKYTITKQAHPVGTWVVPSDAQGVNNGRYMVVQASVQNAVVFRKHIKNVVPNEPLRVSVRHFNMLTTATPQFNVELVPVGASSGISKQIIVTSTGTPTWVQSSADFTDVEVTQSEYIVLIKNVPGNGVVALDAIGIEQDIKLCDTTESVPVVIEDGKKLELEVLGTTAVSCHGSNDGSLRIFVHNPPTNVEYSTDNGVTWTPTVLAGGIFTVTNLEATQSRTIYVRDIDKKACKVETTYVITQPEAPLSLKVVEPINPVRCDAGNIASITFEAIGGNSEYTQFTYQSTTMPTPQVVGVYNGRYSQPMPLSPGVYTITVTDVKGCSTETSFEVEKKEIEFEVVYNPCHDGNGTDVTVNVLNGNGGYVVNRSGETTWHTVSNRVHTFEGLQVGTYTITLNDNSGCKTSTVVNIYPPLTLTVSQTSVISCLGSPNSTFVLTANGGVPGDRTFIIYTTDRANVYTEVTTVGSTYTFTSTDFGVTYLFDVQYTEKGHTCSYQHSQPFRVASKPAFNATPLFNVKGAYCADNGYINTSVPDIVNQSTGVAPFNVEVYANDGTDNPTGAALNPIALATGNYVVVITDARGCKATRPVTVPSLPKATVVTVTTTPIACGVLAQANIEISAGGNANSNFSLIVKTASGTVYSTTNILSSQLPRTITVSNLHYDEYEVILQDMTSPSCQDIQTFKTGLAPDAIVTASTTVVGCTPNSGELIVQSYRAGTGLTHTGNYVAIYKTTIDVNDPTSPGWYQFNPPVATTLPTTGQAGEKLEHTFTGLIPGAWYEFIIVSETPSGDPCWFRGGATISVPTSSTLSMTTTQGTIACSGTSSGTILFTLKDWKSSTTGITWQVYTYPDYNPVAGAGMSGNITVGSSMTSVSGNVNGLAPGRYVIVFEENNGGCVNATPPIAIRGPEPLIVHQVSITKEHVYCTTDIGDQAEITVDRVSGGVADYLFLVQPTSVTTPPAVGDFTLPRSGQFVSALGSQKIIVSTSGTYDLYVKDSGHCIVKYQGPTLTIEDAPQPKINSVQVQVCQAINNQYNVRLNVTQSQSSLIHFYKLEPGGLTPVQQQYPYNVILLEGLNPGVYTLTYSNIRGCETSTTFEVKPPVQAGNANVTRALTCSTTSPAEVVIPNITGGTGTYTYEVVRVESDGSKNQIIPQTTTTATTVTVTINMEGNYEFWLMDSDMVTMGCNSDAIKRPFVIEPKKVPQVVNGSLKVTNTSCGSASEGSIELIATPIDIAPMTFTIISMRDLGTGVTTATSIPPTSVVSNQARFSGLLGSEAGIVYEIKIEGTNGCSVTNNEAIIKSPPPLQVGATALTPQQFTCSTSAALIASLQFDATQITGGVPPYTWQFIDRTTNTVIGENSDSVSLSDVNGGTYYVRVKDSSGGCATDTTDVTINPAFTLANMTVATVTPMTCAVDETIAVSVEATPIYIPGTEIRFTVKRLSDGFVTSAVYSSTIATTHITHTLPTTLGTGDYEITAENMATSCGRAKATHKVADLTNKYDITMSNQKQPTCYQGNDGEITLTVVDRKPAIGGDTSASGFTYTVTYSVNGATTTGTIVAGSSSITLTGLKEGRYSIEIQSFVNSCKATSSFVVPVSAEQISVNAYPAPIPQVSCLNDKGNIMVEVTGGQAPYEVTLSSLATTFTKTVNRNRVLFDNLEVGVYSVTVRDALGCMDFIGTATAELVTPDPLTASITVEDVHCKDEANGKITISNIQGGSGSTVFLFELDNGTTPAIEQSTPVFENLKAGIYTLKITDGMGCWTQTTVEVWEPNYLYAAVDVSGSDRLICYGEADGRVAITAQGGVQPYKMDVYSKDGRRVTPVSYVSGVPADPRIASPVSIVTDPILEAGEYYVTIIDVNGCSTQTVKFTVEEFPNIEPREVYQEKSCDENVFTDAIKVRFPTPIDLTNVTYELKTQAGAITSGTLSRTTDVTTIGYIHDYDRTSETQTLKVIYTYTHSDGSQIEQCEQVYVVTDIEDIKALTVTRVTNLGLNTIEVKTTGGVEPYTYYFNGREQGSNPVYIMKINDPGRVDPDSGQIIKEVDVQVVDALGCTRTLTIEEVYHDIRVPNFFTPDGDGINDTWKPINIENYPKAVIYIFDRNGRKITTLTPMDSWDGIYDKKHMPSGDYWYILELNTLEDTRKFYGNFTLYR